MSNKYTLYPLTAEVECGVAELSLYAENIVEPLINRARFNGTARFAVAPGVKYRCEIYDGEACEAFEFITAENFGRFDSTSATEKFGFARKGAVFSVPCAAVGITSLPPQDENQPLSPWYKEKCFTKLRKPPFSEIKELLPKPILCEADRYLIDAYYYAWSVAFDEWLINPPDKSQSVFYINGCPDWAGQGSSVDYDSAFIMMYAKYSHGVFSYIRALDNIYARQHENGFIIKEGTANNFEVYSSAPAWAQTAYLAWAEYENFLLTGEINRIKEIFLPLVKYYEWFRSYMEKRDGSHPGIQCGHGDWAVANEAAMRIFAVYLNKIASLCGRPDMSRYFNSQAKVARDYIDTNLWDEENGMYGLSVRENLPPRYKAGICRFIRAFDALAAEGAPPNRADGMLEMLLDTKMFRAEYGVRSLSLDSNYYIVDSDNIISAEDMATGFAFDFRRTVWAPNIIFALRALDNYGRGEDADKLGEDYCRAIAETYKITGDIWEHSWDEKIEAGGHKSFCGWGGYGPITCLIERVIGIRAAINDDGGFTVNWNLRRGDRHGIENLRFGDIVTSLICGAAADCGRELEIWSTGKYTLNIRLPSKELSFAICGGKIKIHIE